MEKPHILLQIPAKLLFNYTLLVDFLINVIINLVRNFTLSSSSSSEKYDQPVHSLVQVWATQLPDYT